MGLLGQPGTQSAEVRSSLTLEKPQAPAPQAQGFVGVSRFTLVLLSAQPTPGLPGPLGNRLGPTVPALSGLRVGTGLEQAHIPAGVARPRDDNLGLHWWPCSLGQEEGLGGRGQQGLTALAPAAAQTSAQLLLLGSHGLSGHLWHILHKGCPGLGLRHK